MAKYSIIIENEMQTYLLQNNSKHLIVFFCGWGMDENPFLSLKTSADVLFLYDYETLDFSFDFAPYENITLLAFSYGVYIAGLVQEKLPKFNKKIAVNGTLIPVDDEFGVPVKKFMLSQKMDSETIVKFRERLFHKKEDLEIFNQNLPQRTAQSCTDELKSIIIYFKSLRLPQMSFDTVITATNDKVIPTKNQLNFWKNKCACNTIEIENGHFPFYGYDCLEDLCKAKN